MRSGLLGGDESVAFFSLEIKLLLSLSLRQRSAAMNHPGEELSDVGHFAEYGLLSLAVAVAVALLITKQAEDGLAMFDCRCGVAFIRNALLLELLSQSSTFHQTPTHQAPASPAPHPRARPHNGKSILRLLLMAGYKSKICCQQPYSNGGTRVPT